MTRCYACHRELTNPTSVSLGIGPVCRAKRRREADAQERLDREASKCHFGFVCYNPEHVLTLVIRLTRSLESWPGLLKQEREMAGLEFEQEQVAEICRRVDDDTRIIIDCLGLNRDRVEVPEIEQADLQTMLQTTGHLGNPANEVEPGVYRVPPDIQRQYTRTKLRELKVCPYGLDCRDPNRAVAAVYMILSTLRHEVEPLFRNTTWGGLAAANDQPYWHLANILQVLGLDDEGDYIIHKDIPAMKKQAARFAKKWNRYLDRIWARKERIAV